MSTSNLDTQVLAVDLRRELSWIFTMRGDAQAQLTGATVEGQTFTVVANQAIGGAVLTWSGGFAFIAGTAPVLGTTPGDKLTFVFVVRDGVALEVLHY